MNIFYLALFMSCILGNAGHSAKRAAYEKLRDKKVIGATRYLEKNNLFQCINHCQKISSCRVFNFTSGFQICESTDKRTSHSEGDVTVSKGWEMYLEVMKETIPEVLDFKNNFQSTIKMDFNFTMTDFSVCFWFQYYSNQTRTDHALVRLVTNSGCPIFDIYLATNTYYKWEMPRVTNLIIALKQTSLITFVTFMPVILQGGIMMLKPPSLVLIIIK